MKYSIELSINSMLLHIYINFDPLEQNLFARMALVKNSPTHGAK